MNEGMHACMHALVRSSRTSALLSPAASTSVGVHMAFATRPALCPTGHTATTASAFMNPEAAADSACPPPTPRPSRPATASTREGGSDVVGRCGSGLRSHATQCLPRMDRTIIHPWREADTAVGVCGSGHHMRLLSYVVVSCVALLTGAGGVVVAHQGLHGGPRVLQEPHRRRGRHGLPQSHLQREGNGKWDVDRSATHRGKKRRGEGEWDRPSIHPSHCTAPRLFPCRPTHPGRGGTRVLPPVQVRHQHH